MIVAHHLATLKQSFLADTHPHPTHSSQGERSSQKIDLLTINKWNTHTLSFSLKWKCKTKNYQAYKENMKKKDQKKQKLIQKKKKDN